jgi:hypothetical protein
MSHAYQVWLVTWHRYIPYILILFNKDSGKFSTKKNYSICLFPVLEKKLLLLLFPIHVQKKTCTNTRKYANLYRDRFSTTCIVIGILRLRFFLAAYDSVHHAYTYVQYVSRSVFSAARFNLSPPPRNRAFRFDPILFLILSISRSNSPSKSLDFVLVLLLIQFYY